MISLSILNFTLFLTPTIRIICTPFLSMGPGVSPIATRCWITLGRPGTPLPTSLETCLYVRYVLFHFLYFFIIQFRYSSSVSRRKFQRNRSRCRRLSVANFRMPRLPLLLHLRPRLTPLAPPLSLPLLLQPVPSSPQSYPRASLVPLLALACLVLPLPNAGLVQRPLRVWWGISPR